MPKSIKHESYSCKLGKLRVLIFALMLMALCACNSNNRGDVNYSEFEVTVSKENNQDISLKIKNSNSAKRKLEGVSTKSLPNGYQLVYSYPDSGSVEISVRRGKNAQSQIFIQTDIPVRLIAAGELVILKSGKTSDKILITDSVEVEIQGK